MSALTYRSAVARQRGPTARRDLAEGGHARSVWLAGALCLLCSCWGRDTAREIPSGVLLAKKGRFTLKIPAKGVLESVTVTPIETPDVEVQGFSILDILPQGSSVKKGDPVVTFDPIDVIQQLDEDKSDLSVLLKKIEKAEAQRAGTLEQLEIELNKARLSLEKAQANLDQHHPLLFARHKIIEAELDRDLAASHVSEIFEKLTTVKAAGRADIEMLRIEERKLRTRIADSSKSLSSMQIVAPCDGVLIFKEGRDMKPGDVAWPGWSFMELHEPDRLQVKAYVLEQDAGSLKVDQRAEIVVDAFPGKVFQGKVKMIDTMARQVGGYFSRSFGYMTISTRQDYPIKYFEVILELESLDLERMKPGMAVTCTVFAADTEDVITLPLFSVYNEGDASFVYVLNGGEPERRTIKVGTRSRALAVVLEGLSEGDKVAMRNPYLSYADFAGKGDGQKMEPRRKNGNEL